MNIESSIVFADTVGVCVQSDVRSLITTIVEGPIDRHKSRLASCETGDGLTGTYSGGILDRTESLPKRSREHRAREGGGKSLDGTKSCAREALTFHCPEI